MSRLLSACPALLLAVGLAWGETVRIPVAKDNTLIERQDGSRSDGAGPFFRAGRIGEEVDSIRRGVIAFDLGSHVPPGSVISRAVLTLHMSLTNAGPEPVALHRLLADWGEGDSKAGGGMGAPSEPEDATWIHRFYDDVLWVAPGGDFDPVASASAMVDQEGFYTWGSTAGMVADVQAWADDPSLNGGWILIGNEATTRRTVKAFDSRESSDETLRPVLEVEFEPPCLSGRTVGPGTWHRQCLGVSEDSGGLRPGKRGRGPTRVTEPGFTETILPCADLRLQGLGLANSACQAMAPEPAQEACAQALRDVTGWIFNLCSERIQTSCTVSVPAGSCSSQSVGALINDLAGLILTGECRAASRCAATAR